MCNLPVTRLMSWCNFCRFEVALSLNWFTIAIARASCVLSSLLWVVSWLERADTLAWTCVSCSNVCLACSRAASAEGWSLAMVETLECWRDTSVDGCADSSADPGVDLLFLVSETLVELLVYNSKYIIINAYLKLSSKENNLQTIICIKYELKLILQNK